MTPWLLLWPLEAYTFMSFIIMESYRPVRNKFFYFNMCLYMGHKIYVAHPSQASCKNPNSIKSGFANIDCSVNWPSLQCFTCRSSRGSNQTWGRRGDMLECNVPCWAEKWNRGFIDKQYIVQSPSWRRWSQIIWVDHWLHQASSTVCKSTETKISKHWSMKSAMKPTF